MKLERIIWNITKSDVFTVSEAFLDTVKLFARNKNGIRKAIIGVTTHNTSLISVKADKLVKHEKVFNKSY